MEANPRGERAMECFSVVQPFRGLSRRTEESASGRPDEQRGAEQKRPGDGKTAAQKRKRITFRPRRLLERRQVQSGCANEG